MISSLIISVLIFVHIFFFIAIIRKNYSVIDIGWGLGIILAGWVSYLHHSFSIKNALLLFIVMLWGLRLALYIYIRGRGKGEDPRYTKLRDTWKPHSNIQAYFKIFIFQGILMLIVSLPVSVGMTNKSQSISIINWIGLGIWFLGFSIETWADRYLSSWKSNPENSGKICTTGPWSYSRFPNYFGEVLLWFGIYFVGFDIESAWTIIGPITINFLIVKVTGVPPLEDRYKGRKDYRDYSARVPRFIPFTKPSPILK